MVYIEMDKDEKRRGKATVDLLGSQIGKSGANWCFALAAPPSCCFRMQNGAARAHALQTPIDATYASTFHPANPSAFLLMCGSMASAMPFTGAAFCVVIVAWIQATFGLHRQMQKTERQGFAAAPSTAGAAGASGGGYAVLR